MVVFLLLKMEDTMQMMKVFKLAIVLFFWLFKLDESRIKFLKSEL